MGVVEEAVHPVPDEELVLLGLDVDVGGPLVHRLAHDLVHQGDDGRILGVALRLVLVELDLARVPAEDHGGEFDGVLDPLASLEAAVVELLRLADGLHGPEHRLGGAAGDDPEVVEGVEVQGVAHGDHHPVLLDLQGQDVVLARHVPGHGAHRVGIDLEHARDIPGDAELAAQGVEQIRLAHRPLPEQDGAEPLVGRALLAQGGSELLVGDESGLQEETAQALGGSMHDGDLDAGSG